MTGVLLSFALKFAANTAESYGHVGIFNASLPCKKHVVSIHACVPSAVVSCVAELTVQYECEPHGGH
jgi:hypothetical protein